MFEKIIESTKTTKQQKIALNVFVKVGCVNWIEYNADGSITIQLENVYFGMPMNYTITKKGKILVL